jgi:serine protease AprX
MQTSSFPTTIINKALALLALYLLLCLGLFVSSGMAQNSSNRQKVGADLKRKAQQKPDNDVDVIITPNSGWTSALISDLTAKGATYKRTFVSLGARLYKLKAKDADSIGSHADVAYISLDRSVKLLGHLSLTTGATAARALGGATSYDGSGIGIAVLDSGIYTSHKNFNDINGSLRTITNIDFTGEMRTDDVYGHGSHVAAIAAGSDDVAEGAYEGIAPNAKITNLRVLDSQGKGTVSALLSALDWIYVNRANTTYNIKVVNMSLGTAAVDSYKDDPLCKAVRKLVDAGIVVVAAAGNEGKDSSDRKLYGLIHSPGNDPSVITVGASNTLGTDSRLDDVMASYSSRGPTRSFWTDSSGVKHYDNLIKPDLVAPGNKLISTQSPSNVLVTNNQLLNAKVSSSPNKAQMYLSGTSMAAPAVAGAAALMLQANPRLTPNLVKMILMYTAQSLVDANHFEQGAGQLNVEGAIRLAKLVRQDLSASTAVGAPLLTGAAPTPSSAIAGQTFTWGQGAVMDHSYAMGVNLIAKYQKVYGLGYILADGTIETNGTLMSDDTVMSDGLTMGDNILTVTGVLMSDGVVFSSCSSLMSDGTLMSDGLTMGDGVLMSDRALMSDGVLMADVTTAASNAMINGDGTASMEEIPEASLGALAVTAASKSQINLSWSDNSNNEDGFKIERCQGSTCTNFVQVGEVGVSVKTFSNTSLTANTAYRFRVRAFHSGGASAYTSIVKTTTPAG